MFKHYYLNVLRRGSLAAALAVGAVSCGDSDDPIAMLPPPGPGDTVDPTTLPAQKPNPNGGESGFDDTINQQLAALADSQCVWTVATGTLAITLNAGQAVVVGKRAGATDIVVNNLQCPSTLAAATITDVTLKTLTINGSPTATNETVVLDYANGLFALGSGTAGMTALGTNIDLKTGTADSVKIRGLSTADLVVCGSTAATAGVNLCNLNGGTDTVQDIKTFTGVESVHFGLGDGNDYFFGGGSNSAAPTVAVATWGNFPFGVQLVVNGGVGNDELTGGKGSDTIDGSAGADIIYGEISTSAGADIFIGGTEVDTINYSSRPASEGVDIKMTGTAVSGKTDGAEMDNIAADFENAVGGAGADEIVGTAGDNVLSGGPGNDTISGGSATATGDDLNGDAGDDTFVAVAAITIGDVMVGGDGVDTVDYSARTAAQTINLSGGAVSGLNTELDTLTDIENCIGGTMVDTITGSGGNNRIEGRLGADIINAGLGDDFVVEGGANGLVPNGADVIDGGGGFDTISYELRTLGVTVTLLNAGANDGEPISMENDTLNNFERVLGTEAADTLSCSAALACTLEGNGGIDTLTGSSLDDQLEGGIGEDVYVCGAGNDIAIDDGDQVTIAADCEIKQ
jgi:Ca2+-binding RTX toxin-like protein